MATETTTTLSNNLPTEYYDRKLLDNLKHKLQYVPLGIPKPLPRNNGKLIQWLRYDILSSDTTAISEGVVPTEEALTTRTTTATISQYGNFVKIADLLDLTAIDPVAENALEELSAQAALTLDTLCRDELTGNLPNQFANNKASLADTGSSDVMTSKEILKATITLRADRVMPHESGNYVAVLSPESIGDLMNDENVGSWVDLVKYTQGNVNKAFNGEVGMLFGCRILESQNNSSTTSGTLGSAEVFSSPVLGRGCFGTVRLDNRNVSTYVKSAGSAGTADPLNQISTVGYKIHGFVAKYLKDAGTNDRGVQIRSGTSY